MSESVPAKPLEILYNNTSNQIAGNSSFMMDTSFKGIRVDTTNLLVKEQSLLAGNVGVKTATPRGSLEVTGNTIITAKGTDAQGVREFGLNGNYDSLSLVSPVGLGLNGTTSIFFGLNSLIYYPVARIVAVDNGNYSGSLAFQIGNGQQLYQQMRLTMNGITSGNAGFLYKTVSIPAPGTNISLTFPGTNGSTSIIEVYVILQRANDSSFANMVKFTVFLGVQIYVTNITVQAIGSSTIIVQRNGVTVTGSKITVAFTDVLNDYIVSINYMIYGPATAFLTEITYLLNASLVNTVPGIPSNISATPGNQSVLLNWNAPPDGGSAITGYTVSNSTGLSINPAGIIDASGNFSSTLIADASGTLLITNATALSNTSLNITGLTNGTSYTFSVKAKNSVGYSGKNTATVTPAVIPTAPLSVSAVAANGSATVSWSAPSYNGGSLITSYTITCTPGLTAVISGTVTPTLFSGLTNGTSYTFTVYATNSIGSSPLSSPSNSIIPFTIPDPPINISATPGGSSAIITWTAPANNQGSPIISYTIISTTGSPAVSSNTSFSGIILVSSVNTTTISGLTPGSSYTFAVFVTSAKGNSVNSSTTSPVTILGPPGPPTSLTVIADINFATLSWSSPSNTGGTTLLGYKVYNGTNVYNPATSTFVTDSPSIYSTVSTALVVNGLTSGVSYTLTIVAVNSVNSSTPATFPAFTPGLPSPPSGLTGVAANQSAALNWTAPTSTGGSPITGYKILDSNDVVKYDGTGNVAVSTRITGLTNGIPYTFTAISLNANGASISSASVTVIPQITSPALSMYVLTTTSNTTIDWVGDEVLLYYPYGYGSGNSRIGINVNMPADYLTNSIYYGRRIFTALINPSDLSLVVQINLISNIVGIIYNGPMVSARWTCWALGPAITSLGVNGLGTPVNNNASSPYGIFMEGYDMGDARYLMPS